MRWNTWWDPNVSYPVVHWQLTELWDAFRPFHQQEELLLYGFTNISWTSDLLGDNLPHGHSQSGELNKKNKQKKTLILTRLRSRREIQTDDMRWHHINPFTWCSIRARGTSQSSAQIFHRSLMKVGSEAAPMENIPRSLLNHPVCVVTWKPGCYYMHKKKPSGSKLQLNPSPRAVPLITEGTEGAPLIFSSLRTALMTTSL